MILRLNAELKGSSFLNYGAQQGHFDLRVGADRHFCVNILLKIIPVVFKDPTIMV